MNLLFDHTCPICVAFTTKDAILFLLSPIMITMVLTFPSAWNLPRINPSVVVHQCWPCSTFRLKIGLLPPGFKTVGWHKVVLNSKSSHAVRKSNVVTLSHCLTVLLSYTSLYHYIIQLSLMHNVLITYYITLSITSFGYFLLVLTATKQVYQVQKFWFSSYRGI